MKHIILNYQEANVINIDLNRIEFEKLQDYQILSEYITCIGPFIYSHIRKEVI